MWVLLVTWLALGGEVFASDRYVSGNNTDYDAAFKYLQDQDTVASYYCNKAALAQWSYTTNLTEHNKQQLLSVIQEVASFEKENWEKTKSFAWKEFTNPYVRRWFQKLSILGDAALSADDLNELNSINTGMEDVYSTAKVAPFNNTKGEKTLSLEPDLTRIMATSRNSSELKYYWKAWRDAAGKPIRHDYIRFANLSNKAARLNGFGDTGDLWRESYESLTFQDDVEELWKQVKPLYEQLHAYVRRKLMDIYEDENITCNGPIPAHLLGNMWAQSWGNIGSLMIPFPDKDPVDVSDKMTDKKMTPLDMFQISEEFFVSLGLKPMTSEFWNNSIIEKPCDREIVCHASAWDFCNGKDFRIKQCTDVTEEDLITVHHEMGHIQYFQQYAHLPLTFRDGANPGFHEAVGDVLALSVSTPRHLKQIGLLDALEDNFESDINFLFKMALEKIAFLPFGYLVDLWRWDVFSGKTSKDDLNEAWWKLRLKYQGLSPPENRTEDDFDPGAKYHIPGNTPYIRYFVSFVIQFQFQKSLCLATNHTGPLHKCDIYKSKEAGTLLSDGLKLGSSKPWFDAMHLLTNGASRKMDAGPLIEYFTPLIEWLKQQNKLEHIGWEEDKSHTCP